MKHGLYFLFIILSVFSYSQSAFVPGYYYDNMGIKTT